MLKRLVEEATSGFSSSGEQSSRRKKPATRRPTTSSDEDGRVAKRKSKRQDDNNATSSRRRQYSSKEEITTDDEAGRRKKTPRKSSDDTPTEKESTSAQRKKNGKDDEARRKKARRMKREPLLEYSVIETIHSAMHGKKKKRARQELLELFGSYDSDDAGFVEAEKFKKCIAKVGINLKRSKDVDALVRCFSTVGAIDGKGEDEDASEDNVAKSKAKVKATRVDYVSFADFACNVRDSEKLSAVAIKLRDVIRVYDDKHDRVTTIPYNIFTDLKKLDKNKRGWLASDRFNDFMQDHERPTFRLSSKEIDTLTERFEYEYDKGTLGFDYVQFARWLQPMLHLDKKELHARVKQLIEAAQTVGGWELDELFEAIDESGDGHVSGAELKRAMFDMGLPLTDAQIQCLVEEYDIDGDGKIQYEEFVLLFGAPKQTRKTQESDSAELDREQKRRSKAKANVRNTFSWAINKAFARKHAAQARKSAKASKHIKKRSDDSSSSSGGNAVKKKMKQSNVAREAQQSESSSEEEKTRTHRLRSKRITSKQATSTSEESATSATNTKRSIRAKSDKTTSGKRKIRLSESSTESEMDNKKKRAQRHRNDESNSGEPSTSSARRRRQSRAIERESRVESSKRANRAKSSASTRSRKTTRQHSRSAQRKSQQRSAQSPERVLRRQSTRARSQSAHLRPKRGSHTDSVESARDRDGDHQSTGSLSGLDLDQVRRLQRQPRTKSNRENQSLSEGEDASDCDGDNGDADGLGGENKSDQTYHTMLKKSLRRAFDFFDNEHTQTISKRSIGHVLRALGHEYSSRELDHEIYRSDLDKNGEMDFHEFYDLVKRQLTLKAFLLSKRREMEIRQAFQSLDVSKSGCLGDNEFEFLVYKVLQVELSVEEQDALLDAVEDADGTVHEADFIAFMKTMESFHENGVITKTRQHEMLLNLDPVSRLACSAVKKLIRGAPMDLDKNLLSLLGVPTNYRPALTSIAVCRDLHEVSMAHALGFPCPETIVGLVQDPVHVATKIRSTVRNFSKPTPADLADDEARMVLQQAESWQAHAIVSLKKATGVPKPFDTREDDVIKRCVHVALYQEQEDPTRKRHRHPAKLPNAIKQPRRAGGGTIVGNVLEIPVYWNPSEEDVWEFSRKSTKENKYKFLVRTNNINDHLFLLVEFVVHLRTTNELFKKKKKKRNTLKISVNSGEMTHEMTACWCKIPIRTLLAQRLDICRTKEKLWGGTIDSPIDIEQDEILRRRTGWRAITNAFKKPTPPAMGIKSAPIETYPEETQAFVRKMPPLIIAPFLSLPIVAEYMTAMQRSMWLKPHNMAANLCEPVLKLLPRIVDDHEALSVFRRAFDAEVIGVNNPEDRQKKFQELVLRMWPSFLDLLETVPQALLQDVKATLNPLRRMSLLPATANSTIKGPPAKGTSNEPPPDHLARFDLLQCSAQGKLRLRQVPVAAAPFHVREVTFDRLI